MARYVNADKTLDMMWNALYQYEDDIEKKNGLDIIKMADVQNGFAIAHKVVVDAPAEEVEPVVHAHWLKINNPNYSPFDQSSEYYLFCSNCECGHVQMYNFCPSCGAKMDEEVNDG